MSYVDATIASTCPARFACRRHNAYCSTACELYIDLRYQLDLSGIPLEYRDRRIEDSRFDGREHIESLRHFAAVAAERKPNNGLYLWSATTGNGKTEAACAIAQSYLVARAKVAVNAGTSIGQLVQFVNTTDLLDLLRQAMDDELADYRAKRLIERIRRSEIVVLDDLGAEKSSEWVAERFYTIINGLWTNRSKQTLIVTSNKSLQAIEASLGSRVRTRIDGLTVGLEFKGRDWRRK